MLYSFSGSVAVPQHKNAVEMKNDPHFWHLKQSGRMRRVSFAAGVAEQVQHFLYLFGIFYAELINQAGAALLGNYGTGNAAAGIQLLCQLGNALVFGLQTTPRSSKYLPKQATA